MEEKLAVSVVQSLAQRLVQHEEVEVDNVVKKGRIL